MARRNLRNTSDESLRWNEEQARHMQNYSATSRASIAGRVNRESRETGDATSKELERRRKASAKKSKPSEPSMATRLGELIGGLADLGRRLSPGNTTDRLRDVGKR